MKKIYYRKSDGFICHRYPTDIAQEDAFIEVDDDAERQTYSVPFGKHWAVIDGKLEVVDNTEFQKTEAYKRNTIANEVAQCQSYLDSTDYVVAKLNEARLDEDQTEYQSRYAQYKDVLAKRKESRARINELEAEVESIQKEE